MSKVDEPTLPFLRWAGGKRWLATTVAPIAKKILLSSGGSYYEPFLGSGAMFFGLAPQKSVLSDLNADLVNAFRQVATSPDALIETIRGYPIDKDFYYQLRDRQDLTGLEAAARFIYLNRTCYGGLHRTNKSGLFNVPYGGGSRTTAPLWEHDLIQSASRVLLHDVEISVQGFEKSLESAKSGDVVYCDPTYYSGPRRKQFDRYGKDVFDLDDQRRLAKMASEASRRGAVVLVSNGAVQEIRDLYSDATVFEIVRHKTIGNKAQMASVHAEALFVLDATPSRWRALPYRRTSKRRREAEIRLQA